MGFWEEDVHFVRLGIECHCMGSGPWTAFLGSDDNAVVDGDFAVLEDELQSVLKGLRSAKISIVAIHHHMTGKNPRMIFLHYWGQRKVEDLAKAVKVNLKLDEQDEMACKAGKLAKN